MRKICNSANSTIICILSSSHPFLSPWVPQFVYLVDCEINRMQKLEKFLLLRCQRVIKFLWQIVLGKEWGKDYIREGEKTVGIRSEKKEKGGRITRRQIGQTKTRFLSFLFKVYAVNIENISCLFLSKVTYTNFLRITYSTFPIF